MKFESVTASDGTVIPLTWFDSDVSRCVIVFLPALGLQAKWYRRLGAGLAERHCTVCLAEQRGHGDSDVPVRRGTRFGIAQFVDQDIPAILESARARCPGTPVVLAGHSLGGHLATIYAGIKPQSISGIAHIACGFPYHRDFPPSRARLIRLLCFLIPPSGALFGYFPGQLIGFGGRESIQLMRDWRGWAMTGRFDFGGRTGVAESVSGFIGPVLSVSMEMDDFSCQKAEFRALKPFTGALVSRVTLGETQQGEYLGHFDWAREPDGVVDCLANWVDREVIAAAGSESIE